MAGALNEAIDPLIEQALNEMVLRTAEVAWLHEKGLIPVIAHDAPRSLALLNERGVRAGGGLFGVAADCARDLFGAVSPVADAMLDRTELRVAIIHPVGVIVSALTDNGWTCEGTAYHRFSGRCEETARVLH